MLLTLIDDSQLLVSKLLSNSCNAALAHAPVCSKTRAICESELIVGAARDLSCVYHIPTYENIAVVIFNRNTVFYTNLVSI